MSHDLYIGVSEQSKASTHRFDDACALFNAGRWLGTMYMAGYAVECLLKTKLMQIYGCRTLRDLEDELQRRGVLVEHATVFTHHLELLLRLTQKIDQLRRHRMLWPQFALINRWIPAWRYTADLANRQDAPIFWKRLHRSCTGLNTMCEGISVMATEQLKHRVYDVLKQGYFCDPDDAVDVSDGPGDSIHLVIFSRKFSKRSMKEKHDLIWSELVQKLNTDEWSKISLSIGASPEEIKAT